jgi:SOS response regulatory protein OraA/RecX
VACLRSKGIDDETIEGAVAGIDVSESAYRSAGRKARQLDPLDRETFCQKVMEYLVRRGFDYEVAREAAERHWSEAADNG